MYAQTESYRNEELSEPTDMAQNKVNMNYDIKNVYSNANSKQTSIAPSVKGSFFGKEAGADRMPSRIFDDNRKSDAKSMSSFNNRQSQPKSTSQNRYSDHQLFLAR